MVTGYIDLLTSSGYIEGWAFNPDAPGAACLIGLLGEDNSVIAWGLTHLFRQDLAENGLGTGCCAFRLKLSCPVSRVRSTPIILFDYVSRQQICRADSVPYAEDSASLHTTISDLIANDPTMINNVRQLSGCQSMLMSYITNRGVEDFVRTVYAYTLGRSADVTGMTLYGGMIRQGEISPLKLLEILFDSDEFRSQPRLLSAPTSPGFPFKRQ